MGLFKCFVRQIILVDITVLPTRRGSKGKGEAKQSILSSFEDFKLLPCKFFWSYTPNIEQIKNWHKSLGAEDTNHKIPCARPNYNILEVNMINYSNAVDSLREESLLVVSSVPTSIKY